MSEISTTRSRDTVATALLTAAFSLCSQEYAKADDAPERGTIAIKYLDYLDYQTSADRIRVKATALKLTAPIAGEWVLGSAVVTDGISGASPVYHSAGLKKMQDRRNAAELDLTRYFENSSFTVAANYSHEADYESRAWSFLANHRSPDRNTTWSAAFGVSNDVINPVNRIVKNESKNLRDVLFSVSQVLTQADIVQLNLGFSRGQGYFSDPYKVFDQRPRTRNNQTFTLRWNHHFDSLNASLRTSYRYYSDTWDIRSHTLGLEYGQALPQQWTLTPLIRLYSQSAAKFYVDAGPEDYPFPPNPPDKAVYFSEDHRVSAFGAITFGAKLSKQIAQDWTLDLKIEHYRQAAALAWFGAGSPGLQTFYARSIQVGVSRQF